MSLEDQITELTAAVKENTAAHLKLAEVAQAASGSKTGVKPAAEKASDANEGGGEDDEKPATKPAAKKPAAKPRASRAKKPQPPELSADVTRKDFQASARAYIGSDDAEDREQRQEQLAAALDHLGASKLGEVEDEDIPRIAAYFAYWSAGLEVIFEEVDARVAELTEASSGDDMLD